MFHILVRTCCYYCLQGEVLGGGTAVIHSKTYAVGSHCWLSLQFSNNMMCMFFKWLFENNWSSVVKYFFKSFVCLHFSWTVHFLLLHVKGPLCALVTKFVSNQCWQKKFHRVWYVFFFFLLSRENALNVHGAPPFYLFIINCALDTEKDSLDLTKLLPQAPECCDHKYKPLQVALLLYFVFIF